MSLLRNKKKESAINRSRYSQPQFKRRLEKARKYRRPILSGWSRVLMMCYRFVVTKWRGLLGVLCALFLLLGLSFWRPALFIRHVEVRGATNGVNAEVVAEVRQYLAGRYLVLPRANIAFLSTDDLGKYIVSVNTHVMQVTSIKKKWFRGLAVEITERVPAFSFVDGENHFVVANDGTVLPRNESVPAVGPTVSVIGIVPGVQPMVGERYISGALLSTLGKIRENFTTKTNLPAPTSVELVPVLAAIPSVVSVESADVAATLARQVPVPMQPTLPVVPQEIRVLVPADPVRLLASFYILMSVDEHTDKTFDMLKLLLAAQPQMRLSQLDYVDMRFPAKAFICLKGTSCALEEQRKGAAPSAQ